MDHHKGHEGFRLSGYSKNVCIAENLKRLPGFLQRPHILLNKRVLYCPVEKIATTFWRRLFYMVAATNDKQKYKHPYEVPINTALKNTRLFSSSLTASKLSSFLNKNSFSFLIARNPYSRLLSAFIDKLVPPNPYYWKAWGHSAVLKYRPSQFHKHRNGMIAPGHDVTFAEFLKFAADMERGIKMPDPHIASVKRTCKPCSQTYTYVGKMETFKHDVFYIMERLGLNESLYLMNDKFVDLSIDDAITDSIFSPFSWKKDILKIISWDKALQRIWLKLQMRGIISMDIKLDTDNGKMNNVTAHEFINLARNAHSRSDPVSLKKQKDLVKKEAFASVPLPDIKAFRDVFHADIVMFEYEPSPSYIFDRTGDPEPPKLFFNYDHLT